MEMEQLRATDRQIESTQSRLVRIFLIKWKCLVILVFACLVIFQTASALVKAVLSDEKLSSQFVRLLELRLNDSGVDIAPRNAAHANLTEPDGAKSN